MKIMTIRWDKNKNCVIIIDQTKLPGMFQEIEIKTPSEMFDAIKCLKVRGAPAIGIAAAYGLVLGFNEIDKSKQNNLEKLKQLLLKNADFLETSRPTAVNLFWALKQMKDYCAKFHGSALDFKDYMLEQAIKIHKEDADLCEKMSEFGSKIIKDGMTILTHCNAGALATGGRGTAIGVITKAFESKKNINVLVDETRPLLQGARLTAWELEQAGIPYKVITDNMSGFCFSKGMIDLVITGADRIVENGDTANKIGTCTIAALANIHNVLFYIAAPSSTFDFTLKSGADIPIEFRKPSEVTELQGIQLAPDNADALNPAFDVTKAELIAGYITEKGILQPPFEILQNEN